MSCHHPTGRSCCSEVSQSSTRWVLRAEATPSLPPAGLYIHKHAYWKLCYLPLFAYCRNVHTVLEA